MTILPTARVQVIGRNKQIHNLRALLDTGAHINAVTAKGKCLVFVCKYKTLGLEPKPSNESIIGVNQKDSMPVDGSLKLEIIPKTGENITFNCVVLKTITASENPNQPLSETDYADLVNYNLADDQFWQPGEVDILLGISAYTQIIKGRILKQGSLCLTETTLGWTVTRLASLESANKPDVNSNVICLLDNEIKSLAKFWEIEDVPALPPTMFTPQELACINHYDTTTTYGQNGRPQVLPTDQHETFLIQTVRNSCPKSENHLEKPSDNFWVTKTSFHETQMPKLNTQNSFKRWLRQDI